MRRSLPWFVLLLLVAPIARAQTGEFVLVRRNAFLHASQSTRSERARDPIASEFAVRLGPAWPFRFVAEHGDFVEVAPIGGPAVDHCYPVASGLRGLDIRLFVERRSIVPVVRSTATRTFDDGSGYTLASGVALVSRGRDRYDAAIAGATLRVELRSDEVDWRYRPGGELDDLEHIVGLLAPGGRLAFSGGTLVSEPAGPRAAQSRVIDFSAEDTTSSARAEPARTAFAVSTDGSSGPRVRATVRGRCAEVVGFMRSTDVTTERPARPMDEIGSRRGTSLRPGAALYWEDGTRAGTATPDAVLDGSGRSSGERVCFDQPLRAGRTNADGALTLCVDRSAIMRPSR
jgi:hypothetical protein